MFTSYRVEKVSAVSALSAGIAIREFARREGCDDALVRRAIKQKKLSALPDGTLDPALVGSAWRRGNRRADSADNSADMSADLSAAVRRLTATTQDAEDGAGDPDAVARTLDEFIQQCLSGNFPDIGTAEQVKECGLALKHVLDARVKAGSLIDLGTAEAVIFTTFRSARDAWNNWPARVGPLIAADLGLEPEKVTEVLKAHVHEHLTELGEPDPDFAGQG